MDKIEDGGSKMDDDNRIDFSSLGPAMARERLDVLVARAVRGGEEDLRRRRGGAAVVRAVIAWRGPLLAFSALAAAAAIALMKSAPAQMNRGTSGAAPGTIAEALGVPAAYAESVEGRAFSSAHGTTEKP
jgi:hypothetical protein